MNTISPEAASTIERHIKNMTRSLTLALCDLGLEDTRRDVKKAIGYLEDLQREVEAMGRASSSGLSESAAMHRIESQCCTDPLSRFGSRAVELLKLAKPYVSRSSTIGAISLEEQIMDFMGEIARSEV